MVIPVGVRVPSATHAWIALILNFTRQGVHEPQKLILVEKAADGSIEFSDLLGVCAYALCMIV
jgi:hypothetical protein